MAPLRKDKIGSGDGYLYVYQPNHHFAKKCGGYVLEHRLVWEKQNNASLLPWTDVHHINHIKTDNRPENLRAMTHGFHSANHRVKDMRWRYCNQCGSSKTQERERGDRLTGWPLWHKDVTDATKFLCSVCYNRRYYKKNGERLRQGFKDYYLRRKLNNENPAQIVQN